MHGVWWRSEHRRDLTDSLTNFNRITFKEKTFVSQLNLLTVWSPEETCTPPLPHLALSLYGGSLVPASAGVGGLFLPKLQSKNN